MDIVRLRSDLHLTVALVTLFTQLTHLIQAHGVHITLREEDGLLKRKHIMPVFIVLCTIKESGK